MFYINNVFHHVRQLGLFGELTKGYTWSHESRHVFSGASSSDAASGFVPWPHTAQIPGLSLRLGKPPTVVYCNIHA